MARPLIVMFVCPPEASKGSGPPSQPRLDLSECWPAPHPHRPGGLHDQPHAQPGYLLQDLAEVLVGGEQFIDPDADALDSR
jgi:hypothetical protein